MMSHRRHPGRAVAQVAHLPARVREQLLRGCEVRLAVAPLVDDEPRVVEQLALAVPEIVPELAVAAGRLLVDGAFPAAPRIEAGEVGAHAQTHAEGFARMRRHGTALHGALVGARQVGADQVAVHAEAARAQDDALLGLDVALLAIRPLGHDAHHATAVSHELLALRGQADVGARCQRNGFHGVRGVVHAQHHALLAGVDVGVVPDGPEAFHVHAVLLHDPVARGTGHEQLVHEELLVDGVGVLLLVHAGERLHVGRERGHAELQRVLVLRAAEHVGERAGMAARTAHLALFLDADDLEPLLGEKRRGHDTAAAHTDDDHVGLVVPRRRRLHRQDGRRVGQVGVVHALHQARGDLVGRSGGVGGSRLLR